jgi:hypothetical protein
METKVQNRKNIESAKKGATNAQFEDDQIAEKKTTTENTVKPSANDMKRSHPTKK